jgi:hypothetical protein
VSATIETATTPDLVQPMASIRDTLAPAEPLNARSGTRRYLR